MRSFNGAPVDPDAAGCCVGLIGVGDSYATCMSEPTTSGTLAFGDSPQLSWAFTCDRHAVILGAPRPLNIDDINELDRRRYAAR